MSTLDRFGADFRAEPMPALPGDLATPERERAAETTRSQWP